MENKEKLFEEIIDKYNEDVEKGNHKEGINEYLAKVAQEYNKKYYDSFPSSVKKEDREDLLSVSIDGLRANFIDTELDVKVESIKLDEIDELPLQALEERFVELSIDYVYHENRKASGKVVANPMNVFAGSMFKDFIKEKIDDEIFKDKRYTKREILAFYYYESRGYRKVIAKIMSEFFILLLRDKNMDVKNIFTYVKKESDNQYTLNAQNKGNENILELKCKFKDGYYSYWNDNDERYVGEFNLDLAVPDYDSLLA